MKRSPMKLLLTLLAASALAAGCSWLRIGERPVVVPAGAVVELARPAVFYGRVKDAKTGKESIRRIEAWPGWLIGPGEPVSEVGQSEIVEK